MAGAELPSNLMRGLAATSDGTSAYVCIDGHGVFRVGDGPPENICPDIEEPYFLYYDGPTLSADDERLFYHAFSLRRIPQGNPWPSTISCTIVNLRPVSDEGIRWIHDRSIPVTNDDGEVQRIVGFATAITQCKE